MDEIKDGCGRGPCFVTFFQTILPVLWHSRFLQGSYEDSFVLGCDAASLVVM